MFGNVQLIPTKSTEYTIYNKIIHLNPAYKPNAEDQLKMQDLILEQKGINYNTII